ncbi:MAG: CbiX/SirB N-terminal domain-containing protein [Candidatus Melainabacteria bacterium]|nr:CbiX/SirB N-terminal domain-containing protein [Candidatus Melainabacteria bacterium]
MKKNKYKKYKHCLILIAHGSKELQWRRPFERLIGKLKRELPGDYISIAYIESLKPSLSEVMKNLSNKKSANYIKLLPLFMAAGSHINRDIKELVSRARKKSPKLKIEVLPPIGEHPKISSVICEIIKGYLNHVS